MDRRGPQFHREHAVAGNDQIAIFNDSLGVFGVDARQCHQHQDLAFSFQNIDRRLPGRLPRLQARRSEHFPVHAVGARLTDEIAPTMVNYGHLHLAFDDGSVGWYEAGWGPMMSETAFFVKDMIGPNGCVSIVAKEQADAAVKSTDHDAHTRTNTLRVHHAGLNADGSFARPDEIESTKDEPGHQDLCEREQRLFLKAIRGEIDLSEHLEDAINSLRIVFAADESMRTGEVVRL